MLKKGRLIAAVTMLMGIASIVACTNESKENLTPDTSGTGCDTTGITYTNYVKSVMDVSCTSAGCHDAASRSADIDLSSYEGVKAAANDTKQNTSLLLGAIRHQSGFSAMPQNAARLSDCTISKITAWINAGEPQ